MSFEDPVAWLVSGVTRACVHLGMAAGDGLRALVLGSFTKGSPRPSARDRKRRKAGQEERRREAGFQQLVVEFTSELGFIARECMSREELEAKFDSGMQAEEVAAELHRRIAKTPGIILGKRQYQNGGWEIKLPFSLRDRHMYIIGRSGSGKTNLIKNTAIPGQKSASNMLGQWNVGTMPLSLSVKARVVGG